VTARYATRAAVAGLMDRLSARDLAILKSVSSLRFVSGAQLTRLHFASSGDSASHARSARRALGRLAELDCLARLPRRVGGVRAGSSGFVYHLGPLGQRLAVLRGWQPERRARRSHVPGSAFLGHSLAVAELHTLLIEGDSLGRFELLELAAEPACWRSYGGIGGQRILKPDSYVRVGVGEYEDSYFIEVDMGTEGSQTLDRKLREYVAYSGSGQEQTRRGVFPRVLWLAPDETRVETIERCIRRLPSASRELFAVARQSDAADVVSGTAEKGTNTWPRILPG
jgi:hypothetical protein